MLAGSFDTTHSETLGRWHFNFERFGDRHPAGTFGWLNNPVILFSFTVTFSSTATRAYSTQVGVELNSVFPPIDANISVTHYSGKYVTI
jgi:hypothetical protein